MSVQRTLKMDEFKAIIHEIFPSHNPNLYQKFYKCFSWIICAKHHKGRHFEPVHLSEIQI